ncbi:MAG: orotate phosphoribosyltransferase [Defluviitaleaceae bacterium]|nr:orotate phosphoribosyltransferase [Defluviitaleaceae bacterium]
MNNTKVEEILLQSEALLTGHFLLTSGRHSAQYMQCAKIQQHPFHMEAIAKIVAAGFAEDKPEYVLAPAVGAIVFGYELARQLNAKAIFAERADGKMTLRRGFELPANARVVIAEDVTTTGLTVLEVLDIAKVNNATVLGVGLIVDRSQGKINLGTKIVAAHSKNVPSYAPDDCPLCKEGIPLVKPGSRQQSDFTAQKKP